jgi:extradiol dioxygenase family protein
MRVTTQDLYCGAYILSKGGALEEIQLTEGRNGRPSVTFILIGDQVETLAREFQSGKANTNVASFKVAMTHFKDVMFNTLRMRG